MADSPSVKVEASRGRSERRATVVVESPYLLDREAAAYLRLSVRTLQTWRCNGLQKGPRFRHHGGVVVYSIDDLEAWSDARTATSTTAVGDLAGTLERAG